MMRWRIIKAGVGDASSTGRTNTTSPVLALLRLPMFHDVISMFDHTTTILCIVFVHIVFLHIALASPLVSCQTSERCVSASRSPHHRA